MYPIRVVVVESDRADHRTWVILETVPGIEVVGVTADTDEALRMVAEKQPQIILVDVQRAQAEGRAFISRLRAFDSVLGIIAMTGWVGADCSTQVLQAGADELVRVGSVLVDLVPVLYRVSGYRGAGDALTGAQRGGPGDASTSAQHGKQGDRETERPGDGVKG
jgi:DNA-binding NarL/FixJ family response regulator